VLTDLIHKFRLREDNRQLKEVVDLQSREINRLKTALEGRFRFRNIVASSPAMMRALYRVERAIESMASVLIEGETGTGKEVIARAIHLNGPRRDRPFIAQNCAALPENLLESELFGVTRGAFTGADRDRKGLFEEADGGTMFLDEIGELPLHLQAKLLRVVQEHEVRPLGSVRTRRVDVRILAATNRDLERAAEEGAFRKDLFYRLAVLPIRMPPLRERREDIPYLAEHFLRIYAQREGKHVRGFYPDVIAAFERYEWPGNVRELENEVHRLVAFAASGTKIDLALLSDRVRGHRVPWQGLIDEGSPLREILDRVEAQVVGERLKRLGGNKTATADSLGVNRETLYQKIAKYGIGPVAKSGRGPAPAERSEGSEPPRGNGGPGDT
jgi:transcriptional regulator with PAS, ATPase and Fis domain